MDYMRLDTDGEEGVLHGHVPYWADGRQRGQGVHELGQQGRVTPSCLPQPAEHSMSKIGMDNNMIIIQCIYDILWW